MACEKTFAGLGFEGYRRAVEYLVNRGKPHDPIRSIRARRVRQPHPGDRRLRHAPRRRGRRGKCLRFQHRLAEHRPPAAVQETAQRLMKEMSPTQLHAYSPDQGLPEVRKAVAEYLNGTFSMTYAPEDIYMTSGASAGLAIGCRALLSPGDECITLTPYFSEYRTYTEAAGGVMREVPSEPETFQLDYEAFAAAVNGKTWLVILNSPNNPSGVVLGGGEHKRRSPLCSPSARRSTATRSTSSRTSRTAILSTTATPYRTSPVSILTRSTATRSASPLAARRARRLSRRAAGEQRPRRAARRRFRRGPDAGVCLRAGALPARVRRVPRPDGRAARV